MAQKLLTSVKSSYGAGTSWCPRFFFLAMPEPPASTTSSSLFLLLIPNPDILLPISTRAV
jgi:hypothetical protein